MSLPTFRLGVDNMPNEIKYVNQNWGSPLTNERLSTNGFYTGQQKGTVMQDASVDGIEPQKQVELNTVHMGTILGDAIGTMPAIGISLKQILTDCTTSISDPIISKSNDLSITYHCTDSEKSLPSAIVVKIGGQVATASTDYTWTQATGILAIAKAKLTGDVEVTVTPV